MFFSFLFFFIYFILFTGVLMFFGAVIFSIEISDASPMAVLYFGFGLCLLAGMLGVVTGIVYVIADRRKEL